jgi:hypothetical protein
MKTYDAKFHRLGNRNYIQGSTLIDHSLDAIESWNLPVPESISATCRTIINQSGQYILIEDSLANNIKEFVTVFKFTTDGESFQVGLKPSSETELKRVPYDEDKIINGSKIINDSEEIQITYTFENNLYQILIALFKKLLNTIYPPQDGGKWIFYQIKCDHRKLSQSKNSILSINIQNILGGKSAQSKILLNNEKVGTLFFTRTQGNNR